MMRLVMATALAAGMLLVGGGAAAASLGTALVADSGGATWGKALTVPGLAALNAGGMAVVNSVSCSSGGTCAAGGDYTDRHNDGQAFVVNERNGSWDPAKPVPGLMALNAGGYSFIQSVSCASAGHCVAGGMYTDHRGHLQAFVVAERDGTWGTAVEVPGTGVLNTGGYAAVTSVSCSLAGDCSADGWYSHGERVLAFVVSERHGSWGTDMPVPGLKALNNGGGTRTVSLSCVSAGNCVTGGFYKVGSRSSHWQAFVASERDGRWGAAQEVPGVTTLDAGGGLSAVNSVSCAPAGTCAAGGYYTAKSGEQAFVVSQG